MRKLFRGRGSVILAAAARLTSQIGPTYEVSHRPDPAAAFYLPCSELLFLIRVSIRIERIACLPSSPPAMIPPWSVGE